MTRIRTLVLDYGEVLCHPQRADSSARMARVLGVDEAALRRAYWTLRREYDLGMPAAEYWQETARLAGVDALDEPRIAALIDIDIEAWTDYRPEMWDIAKAFREAGGRTGLLSNGVPEIVARIDSDRPLAEWFDVIVVSFEVHLAKPDAPIYELTLSRLAADPESTLFVDDRAENTDAAARLGIQTVTFTSVESIAEVRQWLQLPETGDRSARR
jgi:putative hydrolase of the HAD superfamily